MKPLLVTYFLSLKMMGEKTTWHQFPVKNYSKSTLIFILGVQKETGVQLMYWQCRIPAHNLPFIFPNCLLVELLTALRGL